MFLEENKSGIGIVIQNNEGLVLASLFQQLDQAICPSGIEALAAHRGLQLASELGFGQVTLEGNAQVLKSTLQNKHCKVEFIQSCVNFIPCQICLYFSN